VKARRDEGTKGCGKDNGRESEFGGREPAREARRAGPLGRPCPRRPVTSCKSLCRKELWNIGIVSPEIVRNRLIVWGNPCPRCPAASCKSLCRKELWNIGEASPGFPCAARSYGISVLCPPKSVPRNPRSYGISVLCPPKSRAEPARESPRAYEAASRSDRARRGRSRGRPARSPSRSSNP